MMTEIGTLAWAEATDGKLTSRQAIDFAFAQMRIQRDIHFGRPRPAAAADHLGRTTVPGSDLALEVMNQARQRLSEPILNHSWRVWTWAHHLVEAAGATVDADLLLTAALLHDSGLGEDGGRRRCFTMRSADIAAEILSDAGYGDHAVAEVTGAIVGHMNAEPPADASPLASALHRATNLDVVGAGRHLVSDDALSSANARYPRDGFAGCFSTGFRRQFLRSPLTRAGVAWAIGLPLAMRINPVARVGAGS